MRRRVRHGRPTSDGAFPEWTPFHPPKLRRPPPFESFPLEHQAPSAHNKVGLQLYDFHHVCDTENRGALSCRYHCAALSKQSWILTTLDLKNTTDDALPNYLHSLKFKQIHTQTDVRLALGYVAVAIAGALFYFDWKFGWEASKPYTAPAVVAYFLLNGAFTYWLWFVEKGVVYEGQGKTGKVHIPLDPRVLRF